MSRPCSRPTSVPETLRFGVSSREAVCFWDATQWKGVRIARRAMLASAVGTQVLHPPITNLKTKNVKPESRPSSVHIPVPETLRLSVASRKTVCVWDVTQWKGVRITRRGRRVHARVYRRYPNSKN